MDTCGLPVSCADILGQNPGIEDGVYIIDPDGEGGVEPFEVGCDMVTDGGGWIRLTLNDSDNLLVAEYDASNPWLKCEDDSAKHFDWIAEDGVTPDYSPNAAVLEDVTLIYQNPDTVSDYDDMQMDAIRSVVTELNPATRMVALTSDDDSGDYQNDMSGGHEVYIQGQSMGLILLTTGEDGQCGGSGDWPYANTESGYYLWNHSDDDSVVDGQTTALDVPGLMPGDLLPYLVRLVVDTGGGVAFGYEQQVILVR